MYLVSLLIYSELWFYWSISHSWFIRFRWINSCSLSSNNNTVNFKNRAAIKQDSSSNTFLRAGYSANADVFLEQRINVVSVKRDIITKDEKTFVEKVVGDQSFEEFEVETGLSDGILIEITGGLDTATQIKVQSDECKNGDED